MVGERVIGGGIFAGSLTGIIIYVVLLFFWPGIVLAITAFVGAALLLGILAWIGYTMATTPPPEHVTEMPENAPAGRAESESGTKQ